MALTVPLEVKKAMDHLVLLVGEGAMRMLTCLLYQEGIQEVCSASWSSKSQHSSTCVSSTVDTTVRDKRDYDWDENTV
jgi:hypothetical protein